MKFESVLKSYGIVVTGGVSTGKSTICQMISDQGFEVIEADSLARDQLQPGSVVWKYLKDHFDSKIFYKDDQVDRKQMRELIFSNPDKKKDFEKVIHPEIHKSLKSNLQKRGLIDSPRFWFYEAPLIFEVNRQHLFKEIWLIKCSEASQIKRLMERDRISRPLACKMIENQWPTEKKQRLSHLVIDTDQSLPHVRDFLLRKLEEIT